MLCVCMHVCMCVGVNVCDCTSKVDLFSASIFESFNIATLSVENLF